MRRRDINLLLGGVAALAICPLAARAEQDVKVLDGGFGVAFVGAFESEGVKSEGVVWARGDELFEFLAASFGGLWLGHGVRGSIISC